MCMCVYVCVFRSSLQLKANIEYIVFIFSSVLITTRLASRAKIRARFCTFSRVYSLSVLAMSHRDTRDPPFEHFHNMAKYPLSSYRTRDWHPRVRLITHETSEMRSPSVLHSRVILYYYTLQRSYIQGYVQFFARPTPP